MSKRTATAQTATARLRAYARRSCGTANGLGANFPRRKEPGAVGRSWSLFFLMRTFTR